MKKTTRGPHHHHHRIDPFSTPARRRRIIADFVKPTLRHYYLTAAYNVYRYRIETAASIIIQCSLRQYQARQRRAWLLYQRYYHAAVIIQCQWRRQLAYWLSIRLRKERYVKHCQRLAYLMKIYYYQKKRKQKSKQQRHDASIRIQSKYRQYQVYKIVKMLQYQSQLRQYWNEYCNSRLIQCHVRGYLQRLRLLRQRRRGNQQEEEEEEERRCRARQMIQKHVLLWWSNLKHKKQQHAEWLRLQQLQQLQQQQLELAKAIAAAQCIQYTYRQYRKRCYDQSISWLVNQLVEDVIMDEIQAEVENQLVSPIYQTWHLSMTVRKVLHSSEEVIQWCLDEQVLQHEGEEGEVEEDRLTIGPLLYYLYYHLLSSEDLPDIDYEDDDEESRLTMQTITLPHSLSSIDYSSLSSTSSSTSSAFPFSSTFHYQTEVIFMQHSHNDLYSNYLITLSSVYDEVASQQTTTIKPMLCLLLVVPNNNSQVHHEHAKVVANVDIFLPALYSRDRPCTVSMEEKEKEKEKEEKVEWLAIADVTSTSSLIVEEELDRQRRWQQDNDRRIHREEKKTMRFRLLRPMTLPDASSHEVVEVEEEEEEVKVVVDYDEVAKTIQRCIRSYLRYRRHLHALEEEEAGRRHELIRRHQMAAYTIQQMWMRYRRVFTWQELCYTLLSKAHHAAVVIQCLYRRRLARKVYHRLYEEEHRVYSHHDFFGSSEEENRRVFGLDFVCPSSSSSFSNELVKEPLLVCPALTFSVSSSGGGSRPLRSRSSGRQLRSSNGGKTKEEDVQQKQLQEEEEGQDEHKHNNNNNSLPRKRIGGRNTSEGRNGDSGSGDNERKRSLVISQNPTIEALQFTHFPLLPPRDQLVLPQQHDYLFAWKALLPDDDGDGDQQDHRPSPFIFDLNASLPSTSTTIYPIFSMEEMGITTEDSCLTLREQMQEVYLDEETRLANESWCGLVQGREEEGSGSNSSRMGLSALYENLIEKDWRYSPSVPSSQV